MKEDECCVVDRMFHRRHVYEHNGGEVDQNYLDKSGDTTVRLRQHIQLRDHAARRYRWPRRSCQVSAERTGIVSEYATVPPEPGQSLP